jgi:hypothetical protein
VTAALGSAGSGPPADRGTLILIGVLGTVLVTGFVVLSALGRDTSGYLLFLGGPAVSAIVGGVLSRRVSHVQEQVTTTAGETQAVVVESASDLASHIDAQHETIQAAAEDARVARLAVARTTDTLPVARRREPTGAAPAAQLAGDDLRG